MMGMARKQLLNLIFIVSLPCSYFCCGRLLVFKNSLSLVIWLFCNKTLSNFFVGRRGKKGNLTSPFPPFWHTRILNLNVFLFWGQRAEMWNVQILTDWHLPIWLRCDKDCEKQSHNTNGTTSKICICFHCCKQNVRHWFCKNSSFKLVPYLIETQLLLSFEFRAVRSNISRAHN